MALIFVLLTSCRREKERVFDKHTIFCGAENLSEDKKNFLTNKEGVYLTGGDKISKEASFSGESSIKLTEQASTGMGMVLSGLLPNELIEIHVQRKSAEGKGGIVVRATGSPFYVEQFSSLKLKNEDGWEFLLLRFRLPKDTKRISELKLFLWSQDAKEPVYFDDLIIKRQQTEVGKSFGNTPSIDIQISSADYDSICSNRDRAIAQNLITKNLKKKYSGILKYEDKSYAIELRLKGDWADHLLGNKWSYRVSIKNGETFLGMKSFSIQDPKTRGFLHEWVLHKLLKKEDVLTTRFHFVPVSVNGQNSGVYALEEHFEKQLIESNKRREGVIVKLNEEGLWQQRASKDAESKECHKSDLAYESAEILPFKGKKTRRTETLRSQFLIAQDLLNKYKIGAPNVSQYMDVGKLARAYALLNIGNIDHSFIWHNQRFYYNPVLSKLEFIAFDCYPFLAYADTREPSVLGIYSKEGQVAGVQNFCFLNPLNDYEFQKEYLAALKSYTKENYIENFVKESQEEIDSLTALIANDYLGFDYNSRFLSQKRDKIRGQIPMLENKIKNKELVFNREEVNFSTKCSPYFPLKNISLSAHIESKSLRTKTISLKNYHSQDLSIIGYSIKAKKDSMILLNYPVKLSRFDKGEFEEEIKLPVGVKKIYYRVVGLESDTIFRSAISPWPRPRFNAYLDDLIRKPFVKNTSCYQSSGKKIIFKKGRFIVPENIVIPKGMEVVFEPGSELVLNKGRFILSYSPVTMIGNERNPIKILSTDQMGQGLTVLQAGTKSELTYVHFEGLTTFDNAGWKLTGAVTFYESPVQIDNCIFTKNNCEDGLNIVRSKFILKNSEVSQTYSDGFDADFCDGEVINCVFKNTGNDCLDFSGSHISIKDCKINFSGDKGVSCGEESQIDIENVSVDNAVLGVASKDNSIVRINNIELKNCQTGFAAFQKKPEYGPAQIEVNNVKVEKVVVLKKIEPGSRVNIKN